MATTNIVYYMHASYIKIYTYHSISIQHVYFPRSNNTMILNKISKYQRVSVQTVALHLNPLFSWKQSSANIACFYRVFPSVCP